MSDRRWTGAAGLPGVEPSLCLGTPLKFARLQLVQNSRERLDVYDARFGIAGIPICMAAGPGEKQGFGGSGTMSDWYYESEGDRVGPVSEERIRELFANGILNLQSLIWSHDFGSVWKYLGETAFVSVKDRVDQPPPLPTPATEAEAAPSQEALSHGSTETGGPKEFLSSDLTRLLIGKNQEHYLRKWEALLEKASYDAQAAAKQRSWNWPAFFIPYGWLFYRKLYGLGALVAAGMFLLSQFLGPVGIALAMGANVAVGLYGDALYFNALYKKWLRLRTIGDAPLARRAATTEGGTNLPVALGAGAALAVAAVIISGGSDFFSSELSCSARNTRELVAKIAREQIPKDGYMMYVVDEQATKISLDAIRTQATGASGLHCAAAIAYSLAFKAPGGETVRASLEQVLDRQITYKVEKTDRGDQIYVTVFGLNN
jgi:GYF domain 2/Protein of unknown function (DUF2628)